MRSLLAVVFVLLLSMPAHAQVVATNLTTGGDGACVTGGTTASITPTANALVLACIVTEATPAGTVTLSGNGLTWVEVATVLSIGGGGLRATLLRASGASPSAGVVTITASADQGNCTWAIAQFTGQDTSGTSGSGAIVQSATDSDTTALTLPVNLGAFGSVNNATMGCFGINMNAAITVGSGFAEVGAQSNCCGSRAMNEFRVDNDTIVDATFASATVAGVAVEIKRASATAGRRRGAPRRYLQAPLFPFFFANTEP